MNAIEVKNFSKIYKGDIRAVDNISFDVNEGIIFGFLGPNGAGKSSTIKMLITLTKITKGTARIFGVDIQKEPSKVRAGENRWFYTHYILSSVCNQHAPF